MTAERNNFDFKNAVYHLTETRSWQKVLSLASDENLSIEDKRRVSWVWPTYENFKDIKAILNKLKISAILSIGCGCGLFEWLLREIIGINVFGLERDRTWWQSKHAVKSFIKLNYIDDLEATYVPETFLERCCDISDKKSFALMFVYFNNRIAFLNYLEMYKGEIVIIVGPKTCINIHTDPVPLEPNFPIESQWKLCDTVNIGTHDVLAIYKKNLNCEEKNAKI